MEKQIAENDAQQALLEAEALSRIKLPGNTRKTEVLVKHIRDSVQRIRRTRPTCCAPGSRSRDQANIMIAKPLPRPRNR